MTSYTIKLHKRVDPDDFATFMREKIFPAVDKGVTRAGKVEALHLYRGNTVGNETEFLWMVDGVDLIGGGAAERLVPRIRAFGTRVSEPNEYVSAGSWPNKKRARGAPG